MSDINNGDSWKIDKLQREREAEFLTTYLIGKSKLEHNSFNDGSFVLNVNAEWGFGKTYFLCNWADDLAAKGHPVVYFDAWQNDFSKEPLVAFISTINTQLEPYFNKKLGARAVRVKKILGEWYGNGKKLLNPSSPLLWGILAKKLAGMSMEQLGELCDDENEEVPLNEETPESTDENKEFKQTVSTVVSKAASQMLASHNSTKKTITEFKNSLKKLTNHLNSLKTINIPIFIFVDELDRCRPDYAIELLEKIKHLFGVPGVFFVVATASEQLCHSIKKVYGQDFDSPNYLKRFFDQTYTLQEPNRYSFTEYLFDQYNLTDRENLFSPLDPTIFEGKNIRVEAFAFMADSLNIGLRDMIQYCIIIDSISLTFKKAPIHLIYLLFLARLKDLRKDLYEKVAAGIGIHTDQLKSLTVNIRNSIDTYTLSGGTYSRTPSKTTALSLVSDYIGLSKMDLIQIHERYNTTRNLNDIVKSIESSLISAMPNSYPVGINPTHHLSDYPKLIEQAGRMTQ